MELPETVSVCEILLIAVDSLIVTSAGNGTFAGSLTVNGNIDVNGSTLLMLLKLTVMGKWLVRF